VPPKKKKKEKVPKKQEVINSFQGLEKADSREVTGNGPRFLWGGD
jgi:hypothetical protein